MANIFIRSSNISSNSTSNFGSKCNALNITRPATWDEAESELEKEVKDQDALINLHKKISQGIYELWNSAGSYLVSYLYKDQTGKLFFEIVAGTAKNSKQTIQNLKEIVQTINANGIIGVVNMEMEKERLKDLKDIAKGVMVASIISACIDECDKDTYTIF